MKCALLCLVAVSQTAGEDPFACCVAIKSGDPVPVGGIYQIGGVPIEQGAPFSAGSGNSLPGIFCEGADAKDQLASCVSIDGGAQATAAGFTYQVFPEDQYVSKPWVDVTTAEKTLMDGWTCVKSATDAFGDCKSVAVNDALTPGQLLYSRGDDGKLFEAKKETTAPHDGFCCGCGDCADSKNSSNKSSGTVGSDSFVLGTAAICLVAAVLH